MHALFDYTLVTHQTTLEDLEHSSELHDIGVLLCTILREVGLGTCGFIT